MTPQQRGPRPGHNGPPRNHNQQRNHNTLRDQDPAGDVVDIARHWRKSLFAAGYDQGDVNKCLNQDGFNGGHTLLELIDAMRTEQRPASQLNAYEQRFIDHMQLEAKLNWALGDVDNQALYSDHNGLQGDAAMLARAQEVRDELIRQSYDPNITDQRQRQRLQDDIDALNYFIDQDGKMSLDPCAAEYFEAAKDCDLHPGDALKNTAFVDAVAELDDFDDQLKMMHRAWRAIANNGYKLPQDQRRDPRQLRTDRRLNYVADPNYNNPQPQQNQNPQAAQGNPNPQPAPQNPNQQQAAAGAGNGGNQQNPPGGNQNQQGQNQNQQPPTRSPQELWLEAEQQWKDMMTARIDRRVAEVDKRLEGSEAEGIKGVRNELAAEKAKIVRNTRVGKWFMRKFFQTDVDHLIDELEKSYVELTNRRFGLENWLDKETGVINKLEYEDRRVHHVEAQANKTRDVMNEKHIRTTLVAKFCKSIGTFEWRNWKSKHYWIAGVGILGSPLTGGLSGAMAAALLTAAKVDASWRGMPKTTQRMTSEQLRNSVDTSLPQKQRYRALTRSALSRLDSDVTWEKSKRWGALGLGVVAIGGYYTAAAAANGIMGYAGGKAFTLADHYGVIDAWRDFAGPADLHLSEFSNSADVIQAHMQGSIVDAHGNVINVRP